MGNFVDLTGQKFGKLTVLKRVENYVTPKGSKKSRWLCKCECGNEIIVIGYNLKNSHTQSCGCYASEVTSKAKKKYNTYDLSGEYGIGYTSKGEEFYFDLEDYDLIKNYCWRINSDGYVSTNIWINKTVSGLYMHRIILGCENSEIKIDHINHEKYNNQKYNLRIATSSQNNMNASISKNNTSGVTGVYFDKKANKWTAQITINKQTKSLGFFDDFEKAVKTRLQAENKYFGEYSYSNSMNGGTYERN